MHQAALNIQDHLDLWKFFTEDAAKIKGKLWAYGLIGTALALAALPLCAQSYDYRLKIPYRAGAKWGYCDTLGRVLHTPRYDSTGFFDHKNPLAVFVRRGKWGLLDSSFHTALAARYDALEMVSMYKIKEGEILLVRQGEMQGLCRISGKPLMPLRYDSINLSCWYEGFIPVRRNGKWGAYASDLTSIAETIYDRCYLARRPRDPQITAAESDLLGYYCLVVQKDSAFYLLYSNGKVSPWDAKKLPWEASGLGQMGGRDMGLTRRQLEQNLQMGMYPLGNSRVHLDREVDGMSPGLYDRVLIQNSLGYALFDLKKKEILPHYYEDILKVAHFNGQEYWYVKKQGKYGIVNEKGEVIWPFLYDGFERIQHILAVTIQDGKKGALQVAKSPYEPVPCRYEDLWLLKQLPVPQFRSFNVYGVRKDGKFGLVGENGVEYFK